MACHFDTQYLWIDALCIIQDDPDDWNEQAALMNIIYERGVVNLAGVMGEEANGLRVCRDPLRVFRCALNHPCGETWELGNWNDEGLNVLKSPTPAPLYERGWTFQERVLSIRTLHFGAQLLWECSRGVVTETSNWTYCPPTFDVSSSLKQALRNPVSTPLSVKDLLQLWLRAVETFSKMDLTKPSDRIPALQGIANRFGHFFNMDPAHYYVAGLWLFDSSQLAWFSKDQRNWLTSKDDDLARELSLHYPSWSWAISTEGARFENTENEHYNELLLVEFGMHPTHDRGPANIRSMTIDKCISVVSLSNILSSSNMLKFSGITLRGKFIHYFDIRRILRVGRSLRRFPIRGFIPVRGTEAHRMALLALTIILDRPISNTNKRQALKLLPICGRRTWGVDGILVVFCGFDDGLAVYRRLGHFSVTANHICRGAKEDRSIEALEEYLHLPPYLRLYFDSDSNSESDSDQHPDNTDTLPTTELRRDFDEFPPFKLI